MKGGVCGAEVEAVTPHLKTGGSSLFNPGINLPEEVEIETTNIKNLEI